MPTRATDTAMRPSDVPVETALDRTTGPRRLEAEELLRLFRQVTGVKPVVWAGRIVGFGEREYRHASGRSGIVPEIALATGPREHVLYLADGAAELWPDLFARLGRHRVSTACVYLPRLSQVDADVLRELLIRSLETTREAPSRAR